MLPKSNYLFAYSFKEVDDDHIHYFQPIFSDLFCNPSARREKKKKEKTERILES